MIRWARFRSVIIKSYHVLFPLTCEIANRESRVDSNTCISRPPCNLNGADAPSLLLFSAIRIKLHRGLRFSHVPYLTTLLQAKIDKSLQNP